MAAGLLGQHNSIASRELIEGGVLAAMLALICSAKHKSQLAGLQVLASLALVSNEAAQKLMSQRLLTALQVGVCSRQCLLFARDQAAKIHCSIIALIFVENR